MEDLQVAKELAQRDIEEVDLSTVSTMEEAVALWERTYRSTDVLGDGFTQVEEKQDLVGVDFFIVKFKEVEGDFGTFVMVWVVTQDNRRLRFSDGSTGVKEQLLTYREKTGQVGGLAVPRGLVRSDYEGPVGPATTYYLAEG